MSVNRIVYLGIKLFVFPEKTFSIYWKAPKYTENLHFTQKEKLSGHPFLVEHNSVTDVFRFSNFV